MSDAEHKLQIDDDWKSEAAAEKRKLADEVETQESAHGPLPDASFIEIIQLLGMQAMVGLGGMRGPGGQDIPPNMDVAKHHIDLLSVLEQKTTGNLQPQEKQILETTLYQLRMAYVETMKMIAGAKRG